MKKFVCLAMLFATATLQPVCAADWKMDPSASKLEFLTTFEKTENLGVFKEFDTVLHIDAQNPAGNRLDVTINIKSVDMSSSQINDAIAGPDWFNFALHPQAEFHATNIARSPTNPQAYIAHGTLTLKGVQQPVDVLFTWKPAVGGAIMEGGFTVKRGAFGIGSGEWALTEGKGAIGADVTVKFHVLLRKAG
jgi:polyisoprenoid-binding protein YceI